MAQHVWLYGGDADPTDTLATIHSGELAPVRVELADGCLTKIVLASRAGGLEESVGQIAGAIAAYDCHDKRWFVVGGHAVLLAGRDGVD